VWDAKRTPKEPEVNEELRKHFADVFKKSFSLALIQGMPVVPTSYVELYKTVTGAIDYPLTELEVKGKKSRISFAASKKAVSRVVSKSVSDEKRQASKSVNTRQSTADAEDEEDEPIINQAPARKSLYARVKSFKG
jgi:hypothetical protein